MSSTITNRTPWLLVISSMVLLFLFVGYWNVSSYLREKKKLVEDVEIQLQLAFTEIKDSELVYFIRTHFTDDMEGSEVFDSISIYFDESTDFPASRINFQSKILKDINLTGSGQDTAVLLGIEIDTSLITSPSREVSETEVTIVTASNINSVVKTKFEERGDSIYGPSSIHQFDIHGPQKISKSGYHLFRDSSSLKTWVNMNDSFPSRFDSFYNGQCDSILSPHGFFDRTVGGTQTSVDKTYALFKSKLKENNLPYEFSIVKKPDQEIEGMKITYETNGFGFKDWSIDLQNYQWFILKKMIPILLFSFFLLGIITFAFWTLLKNWTKEKRLALVKNEFMNNMTHELKTPIATVGVALEAISNFDLSQEEEKAKEYLEMSRSEISRLSLLVDKVLNIAAFDSRNPTIHTENVDLEKIINDNIIAVKLQLEKAGAQLDFVNKTNDSIVKGDALHLSNIVHNMIDNAIKYSTDNPKIEIQLMDNHSHYILTFKDNGLGIPKAYQDKIFDRFFRVPTDDIHNVKGHGLGLNYVQNVVNAHDGNITIESTENQGTTFTITLPKKRADA